MFANFRVVHIILLAILLTGEQSRFAGAQAAEPFSLNSNQAFNSVGATLRSIPPSLRAETATMLQSGATGNMHNPTASIPNPAIQNFLASPLSMPQLPSAANAPFAQAGLSMPTQSAATNQTGATLNTRESSELNYGWRAQINNSHKTIIDSTKSVGKLGPISPPTMQLPPATPPVFVAPTLEQMPGLKTASSFNANDVTRSIPYLLPADGAQYTIARDGSVALKSGQLLVSTLGRKGFAEVSLPDGTRVFVRRASTALITTTNGISQVTNTSGAGLIIDPPGSNPVDLSLGHEFTSSPGGIARQTVRIADTVPRRDLVVNSDGQTATAEVSLPNLATQNTTLRKVLSSTSGTVEHGIGEAVSKAAAAQRLVRGGERFGINTVEALVQNLLQRLHAPGPPGPPGQPPPGSPPPINPPPTVPPGSVAVASVSAQTLPQSAAANSNNVATSHLASSTANTSLPPGSPADQTLPIIRALSLTKPRRAAEQSTPGVQPPANGQNNLIPPQPLPYAPPSAQTQTKSKPAQPASSSSKITIGTAANPAENGTPWYLAPLAPFLNGVPLSEIPDSVQQAIKRHPNIAAAVMVLIALLLSVTTYFWWMAHRRSLQLAVANEEIRQARDQAIAGSKAKSDFMANISHEIRTPLTVILGLVGMLIELKPTGEQSRLLELLKQSAQHLMDLLTGILDFSKIEANRLILEFAPFSLADTIRGVVEQYRPAAISKGLNLSVEIHEALPETLIGDSVRLRQILSNLVSNAIKFTETGAINVMATSSLQGEQCMTVIRVRDTGIGISKEHVDTVFQPFVQADASTTRRFGGTGLGLAISRRLAQMMGGDLSIESTEGVGSELLMRVPFVIGVPGSHIKRQSNNHIKPDFAGKRVLVAEDSPVLRQIVKAQLIKFGCLIDVVENGQQAVEAAKSNRYDLIFMDWQMPVMDGLSATRNIRAITWENRKVPIVAMTANAMEGDRTTCIEAGCSDYLSKPFSLDQLRDVLNRWLKSS